MPFTPFLKSFNLFTEAEISKIQNSFSPIRFEEQDIMLHEGEICDRIFYISEGVLREFVVRWTWIYFNPLDIGWGRMGISSYVSEQPSTCYLQALTAPQGIIHKKRNDEGFVRNYSPFGLRNHSYIWTLPAAAWKQKCLSPNKKCRTKAWSIWEDSTWPQQQVNCWLPTLTLALNSWAVSEVAAERANGLSRIFLNILQFFLQKTFQIFANNKAPEDLGGCRGFDYLIY